MKVVYELEVIARCRSDGKLDLYHTRIESEVIIQAEVILAEVRRFPEPIFQEELTVALARALGARVTTVGNHYGIKTTCSA